MLNKVLAWDIETVPDFELARILEPSLEDSDDDEVEVWLGHNRNTNRNYPENPIIFPKLLFHQVVSISGALWTRSAGFELFTYGKKPDDYDIFGNDEKSSLLDFHANITDLGGAGKLQLVTFNGKGFDSVVMAQRSMIHSLDASTLLNQTGDRKWDNYIGRYLPSHCDLMDALAHFSHQGRSSLHDISIAIGLPGKIGVGGPEVLHAYKEKKFQEIDDYCEIDSLVTLLVFYRYIYLIEGPNGSLSKMKNDLLDFFDEENPNPLVSDFLSNWDPKEWL